MPELKARAFEHIVSSLTVETIPYEAFSSFSDQFREVRKVQIDMMLQHWVSITLPGSVRDELIAKLGRDPRWAIIEERLQAREDGSGPLSRRGRSHADHPVLPRVQAAFSALCARHACRRWCQRAGQSQHVRSCLLILFLNRTDAIVSAGRPKYCSNTVVHSPGPRVLCSPSFAVESYLFPPRFFPEAFAPLPVLPPDLLRALSAFSIRLAFCLTASAFRAAFVS